MKTYQILILFLMLAIIGCAHEIQRSGVSSPSLSGIGEKVTSAQDKVKAVAKVVAKPQAETLNSAVVDLDDAKKQLAEKQGKIDAITKERNDVVEERDGLVRDNHNLLKALWKTRLIYLPIACAVFGIAGAVLMAIFRLWLKANVPFIGGLIP